MKKQIHCRKLFLLLMFTITTLCSSSQKQFIHVSSKSNNSCNGDCTQLDIPELNNNPAAILFVTPVVDKGVNVNPHPIGVYYVGKKWNIFNLDQKTMPDGAKFNVEYFMGADASHFQYLTTNEDLQTDGSAFIDHRELNNNPNLKPRLFHSWVPETRGIANREEISVHYNAEARKWAISNINKKPLFAKVAYNIAVTPVGKGNTQTTTYNAVQVKELTTDANSKVSGNISSMLMTVWVGGTKLPGDGNVQGFLDKTQIQSFEMGVSSIDVSGQTLARGRRDYELFTIKSNTGSPVTVPLFDAFVKNQDMVFLIEGFTISNSGTLEVNYSMKLTGVRIVSFKQVFEDIGLYTGSNFKKYYDEIKIIFTKIEMENSAGYIVVDAK